MGQSVLKIKNKFYDSFGSMLKSLTCTFSMLIKGNGMTSFNMTCVVRADGSLDSSIHNFSAA